MRDGERLARVVTYPNHKTKNGELKPSFFPTKHLRESGFSMMRPDQMTREELEKQALVVAGTKEGEALQGVRMCLASQMRAIRDETRRSLCVMDDPVKDDKKLPDNPAHAMAIRTADQPDDELLRIRMELVKLFGPITAIADVHKQARRTSDQGRS